MKLIKRKSRLENKNEINLKTNKALNDAKFFEKRIATEWLSTRQAAEYLSITPNALRILVHRGKVTYFKFGSRLRFCLCDLRKLLVKQEV